MDDKRDLEFERTVVRLSRFKRSWTLEMLREAIEKIAQTGHIDRRSNIILDEMEKENKRGISH